VQFANLDTVLGAGLQLRLFGKPDVQGKRRMGVALATGDSIDEAVERAIACATGVKVSG
ncbi:MAG TPA: phosphoribosylglycinamide formyltransferase 2, partial [Erwinia sp.]|nr:phosphoribosylglycinamide formyltransferase 2 [Erwinia sp.]